MELFFLVDDKLSNWGYCTNLKTLKVHWQEFEDQNRWATTKSTTTKHQPSSGSKTNCHIKLIRN